MQEFDVQVVYRSLRVAPHLIDLLSRCLSNGRMHTVAWCQPVTAGKGCPRECGVNDVEAIIQNIKIHREQPDVISKQSVQVLDLFVLYTGTRRHHHMRSGPGLSERIFKSPVFKSKKQRRLRSCAAGRMPSSLHTLFRCFTGDWIGCLEAHHLFDHVRYKIGEQSACFSDARNVVGNDANFRHGSVLRFLCEKQPPVLYELPGRVVNGGIGCPCRSSFFGSARIDCIISITGTAPEPQRSVVQFPVLRVIIGVQCLPDSSGFAAVSHLLKATHNLLNRQLFGYAIALSLFSHSSGSRFET